MLEIKDSKQVEENEHIRFRCMRCATCCRHVRGSVVIEGLDAYRLAQHLKMEVADFISQYADPFLLDEQLWYPIFSLRVKGNDDSCRFPLGHISRLLFHKYPQIIINYSYLRFYHEEI